MSTLQTNVDYLSNKITSRDNELRYNPEEFNTEGIYAIELMLSYTHTYSYP